LDPLKNSLVFSWAFIEIAIWFWIYTNLRDERGAAAQRILLKRKERMRMERLAAGENIDDDDE
jgi:Increased loss of mitochondrial DNA protein 1